MSEATKSYWEDGCLNEEEGIAIQLTIKKERNLGPLSFLQSPLTFNFQFCVQVPIS